MRVYELGLSPSLSLFLKAAVKFSKLSPVSNLMFTQSHQVFAHFDALFAHSAEKGTELLLK